MKKSFLILYLIIQGFYSFASGILQGTIFSESNEALIGAHIYIPEIAKGTIANGLGQFQFQNIKSGKYTVEISFIGFETQKLTIEIRDGQTISLKTKLKEGGLQLADLVVSASNDRPVNTLSQTAIKLYHTQNIL